MELKEQLFAPTLASKLGDVPHVSGVLRRLAQISGANERVADWLLKAAVRRGDHHYRGEFDRSVPPDSLSISDEEIVCLGQHPYDLDQLRASAQLLSSPRVNGTRLCRLAVEEVLFTAQNKLFWHSSAAAKQARRRV